MSNPTYAHVSGFPTSNELANETPQTTITESMTTGAVGDLVIALVHNGVYDSGEGDYTDVYYSESISDSANAITWQSSASERGQDTSYPATPAGMSYEIWYGVVKTASTTTTVTSTFGSPGATDLFLYLDQWSSSSGSNAEWEVSASGFNPQPSADTTTITFSDLTSGTGGGIYWAYSYPNLNASGVAGSTSGFSYYLTPSYSNVITYNGDLAASTAYEPTCTQTTAGWYDSIAAIFVDTYSGGGDVAVTLVQGVVDAVNSNACNVDLAATTEGNLLVALMCSSDPATGEPANVVQSAPEGWIAVPDTLNTETGQYVQATQMWYYPDNPGGLTFQEFTIAGSTPDDYYITLWVAELNINGGPGTFDVGNNANGDSATQTVSVTTENAHDVVLFGVSNDGSGTVDFTTPSGYTLVSQENDGNDWFCGGLWFKEVTSTGAQSPSTTSSDTFYRAAIASFKVSSGGGASIASVLGVSLANISSVSGVAIANIASIAGVTA